MDRKIKEYIAEKKLTDADIYKLLTAEPVVADEEQEDNDNQDNNVEEDEHEDDSEVEEVATEEQPDINELVKKAVAEQLAAMKGGKKSPKITKKPKKQVVKNYNYNQDFGKL